MDAENALPLESRTPTRADLLFLCRSLNANGAKYIVVGGFAMAMHGLMRATMDIDLLIEGSAENQRKVQLALEALPDKAARQLEKGDLEKFIVVRVADEFMVDLMLKTCGLTYEEAASGIQTSALDGVSIPFASAKLMLRLKQTYREKDAMDRHFLEEKLRGQERG
jgi:hypothetical protein